MDNAKKVARHELRSSELLLRVTASTTCRLIAVLDYAYVCRLCRAIYCSESIRRQLSVVSWYGLC